MSFLMVFLLMALTGGCSGLAVAWWYERQLRLARAQDWERAIGEIDRLAKDGKRQGEELAMQKGIGIGRECDALQRRMADGLRRGKRVTVYSGEAVKDEG